VRHLVALALVLPAAACADAFAPEDGEPLPFDPPLPPITSITASTSGPGNPQYIYRVDVDGVYDVQLLPGKPVEVFSNLGEFRLTGIAPGCTAAGNPRTVPLSGDTIHVHFDVTCHTPPPEVAALGQVHIDGEYIVGYDSLGRSARVLGTGLSPVWRPDGKAIAFIAWVGPARQVMVLDMATGSTLPVGDTFAWESWEGQLLAWHPDGSRVAFGSGSGLRLLDVPGGGQVTLEPGLGVIRNVDWSPSGDSLVVSSDSGIALVAADASGRRVLAETYGFGDASPSWSPGGEWIAIARNVISFPGCPCGPGIGFGFPLFSSRTTHAAADNLILARSDGTGPHIILETSEGGGFAWSPDGSRIAYTGSSGTVHVALPGEGSPVSLGVTGIPSWTADGRIRVHGAEGLHLFEADGTGATVVVGPEEESMLTYGGVLGWR
jgi:WD40 repeat protein